MNQLVLQTLTSKISAHVFLLSQKNVPTIKKSNSYLCLLLLSVSADINPNPGPSTSVSSVSEDSENSTYYPCGTCHRHVTWEDRAVCCEECYTWYHIDCHNIHTESYENLKSPSASWICNECGVVNFSQHAFQSSIHGFGDLTSNSYHPISDSFNSTLNTDASFNFGLPMYTSSPEKSSKPRQPFRPKKRRTIRVVVVNCQSLKNKPELLKNMTESMKPDVIIGTESWLIPDYKENGIMNSEIFPEGYRLSVARRDRQEVPCYADNPDIRGGGTFVLVKDDIIGLRQTELETDCEIVWTKFEIAGCKSVYVASFYRPHESDRNSIEELQKSLERLCNQSASHIWVGGDFNFPGYNWTENRMKSGCSQPELTRNFLDIVADNGLTQIVKEPTYYENTLDLFLVSNPSIVHNSQVIPGISRDGHHAVYVELDISLTRRAKKPRKIHSYKKADWDGLKSHMNEACEQILENTSESTPVDEILSDFTTSLNEAIDQHVPSRMTKTREKPSWITPETKRLLHKQRRLFEKQRGNAKASRAAKHYRSLKAFTQRSIRNDYWKHVEGIITDDGTEAAANDKKFWKFIKQQRQDAQGVAPLKCNGKMEDDPAKKANILNEQFQSVFSPQIPLSLKSLCTKAANFIRPDGSPNNIPKMPAINVTEEGVKRRLQRLNPHKAAGPDKINPLILRELADIISPVITRIYRASLTQSKTPDVWKEAHVTPVFKKGEKYKAVNYRPVSLTCILCKQLEHILASNIMEHLNNNNLLYAKQHGFRSKLSCETQLLEFTADALKTVQDRKQCDTIVMDFSKAFDKVSHNRLLFKIDRAGIDPQTSAWIKSWLWGRSQKVVVDGEESDGVPVTSGVPQGSVLGPILFLIFIDDLPEYTKHSEVRLFADDTIVYLTITSVDDCLNLQEDLKRLEEWEKEWQMEFHPAKCNILRITKKKSKVIYPYSLHGHTLKEVKSAKYLGITISDDLSWNQHIEKTASKANSKLGFLKRNIKVKDRTLKEKAYKTIVRPTVEYCATIWDPHTKVQATNVEKVQRRAARWVTGRFHNTSSVSDMLINLGWRSLQQRRVDMRLAVAYKIVHGLVAIPLGPYLNIQRNMIHLQPIAARTKYYQYSFFPRTVSDWNQLPRDILLAKSLAIFKSRIANVIHDVPY